VTGGMTADRPVRVLGLAGSCRSGGNTETLLDWCLDAAEAQGAHVSKVRLDDFDLHGCRGCNACSRDGACIQNDDMHRLYPWLRGADSIALAAPVYAMGVPALPKMVIDRCQPFWALKYVLGRRVAEPSCLQRRGLFLSCGGTDFEHLFDGSRTVLRYFWHVLEMEAAEESFFGGIDGVGEIAAHPTACAEATEMGRWLAETRPLAEQESVTEGESKT
jgi:putative NADPH-quinone reductase